jgi:ribosomal protein S17
MTNILFIDILLNGFFDDASLLKEYLIRNQKNAEKETFITQQEFYERCHNVITIFENKIDYIFFTRQNDLYMIADLRESENKPFEKFIVEAEELSKKSFSLNLLTLTNGRFIGKLTFDDIQYIKNILNEITLKTEEKSQENKLTISEIALKCFYEGKVINRENAKSYLVGTKYTSGERLYNKFIKWSNNTDRKAYPESKVKLRNKIESFEKVIALLPEDKNGKAIDELKILNSFISKYQ